MKLLKKIAAAAAAAAFLLAGCSGDTTWAYRNGGEQMPTGLYILYEINAISEAGQIVTDENKDNADFEIPTPSELLKLTVDGQPASDWINAETQSHVLEHFAAIEKFNALGLQLTESELQSVDSSLSGIKAQAGDFYEKNGISDASIKEYYMGQARKNRIFLTIYGEGGEFEASEDELKSYFTQNYVMVDAMPLYKPVSSDDETKSVEQLTEEVKADANRYLEEIKQGKAIEEIAYDWQLKNTDEAEHASVPKPTRDDLRLIVTDSDRASFGDEFIDAIFASSEGSPQMVEDPSFFAVFNRVDALSEPDVFESYKSTCLWGLKEDEYNEKLREWGAALTLESNNATIERYKPSKLKLDDAAI